MEVSTRNLRKYRIRGEENEECKISVGHATYRSVGSGTKVFGQYMQNCLSIRAKQRFCSEVLNDPGENGRCGNGPLKDNQRSLEIHISPFYSPYDFLFDYDTFINFHYRWPKKSFRWDAFSGCLSTWCTRSKLAGDWWFHIWFIFSHNLIW